MLQPQDLFICTSLYLLMTFTTPYPPLPLATTDLFSEFLFDSMCGITQYLSLSDLRLTYCIMTEQNALKVHPCHKRQDFLFL